MPFACGEKKHSSRIWIMFPKFFFFFLKLLLAKWIQCNMNTPHKIRCAEWRMNTKKNTIDFIDMLRCYTYCCTISKVVHFVCTFVFSWLLCNSLVFIRTPSRVCLWRLDVITGNDYANPRVSSHVHLSRASNRTRTHTSHGPACICWAMCVDCDRGRGGANTAEKPFFILAVRINE